MTHRYRTLVVGVPIALGAVALASCGIPTGEDTFSEIPEQEILFDLDQVSTSTSTTTTSTVVPIVPETTALETTTTIALDQVEIYMLSRGRLQPVTLELARDYGPNQVTALLEAGPPPGAAGVGLESLIEAGLITSAVDAAGVVTIDLDPEIFGRIASFDQSEAIGQIVLTMTSNLRRVGLVLFTLGGEPTQVKKGDSLLSGEGEPVSYDDYRVLLASSQLSSPDSDPVVSTVVEPIVDSATTIATTPG